jgi:hypoxanthine-DNA glycosylase
MGFTTQRGISLAACFEPVAGPDARVLILGSVPGARSIELGQYYGHERNAFWPLMQELLGDGETLRYDQRIELVLRSRIALWDVLASAERRGSLDAAIEAGSEVPNDIAGFLAAHPRVTSVFFNGAKAESLFDRYVRSTLPPGRVTLIRLPSTSPANAAVSLAAKREAWRAVVDASRA